MSEIVTSSVDYTVGGATHVGYLALNAGQTAPRPGILIIHEWWGINDYIKERAHQLAELGYAALAIDMYGDGKIADNPDQAASLMNSVLGDMESGTARLKAGLELLCSMQEVDEERVGAIGYCFGGAMALHMARVGLPLKAVVTFHAALGSFHKPAPGEVQPRILVCHGGDDAMVSADDLAAFKSEMDEAEASYTVLEYAGAKHGFTNPAATERGQKYGLPLAHDAEADQSSWRAMCTLFSECLNDVR